MSSPIIKVFVGFDPVESVARHTMAQSIFSQGRKSGKYWTLIDTTHLEIFSNSSCIHSLLQGPHN